MEDGLEDKKSPPDNATIKNEADSNVNVGGNTNPETRTTAPSKHEPVANNGNYVSNEDQKTSKNTSRELKVEDALFYLDQVKMQFSDKPHIYNEFLDIMKNFKAQSINTPGVIERVRTLFRGYNKLILGFNTFLPDGYKIELTAEEIANESAAEAKFNPAMINNSVPPSVNPANHMPASAVPANLVGAPNVHTIQSTAIPQVAPSGPPQMQQQHAISYVTAIRNRFANEPETYRAFLKILHTYQKEQKGIKEVLEQVSELFQDHADLLMEFTYFLPDAVQEQAKERLQRAAREAERRKLAQQMRTMMPPLGNVLDIQGNVGMVNTASGKKGKQQLQQLQHNQHLLLGGNAVMGPNGIMMIDNQLLQANNSNRKGVLNNNLVQNMNLVPNVPNVGGITGNRKGPKRKLNDVDNHGLNLSNITQAQYNALLQQQSVMYNNFTNAGGMNMSQVNSNSHNGAGMNHQSTYPSNAKTSATSGQNARNNNTHSNENHIQHISVSNERKFFDAIKDYLLSSSRDGWLEFIKILDLFISDAISKKDLLSTVADLFKSGGEELFDEFKRLLLSREDFEGNPSDLWFATPLSEIDFQQCRKCTPSYRALPTGYPKAVCTEKDEMEASVLNDQWVSIPIGSEESYSFKHMRKNQYEEALFKCEDDRFEIDMIIDTNMSTIRILQPIAEEISNLSKLGDLSGLNTSNPNTNTTNNATPSSNPKISFYLEKRNFTTVHLNAISRIYGEHGGEILELLRKNPAGTIPVVLRRLKQKDIEWRKAREELNKSWFKTMEANFDKSFDHRSFYFKAQDKRSISLKHLIADIKGGLGLEAGTSLVDFAPPCPSISCDPFYQDALHQSDMKPGLVLTYPLEAHTVHGDIYDLITHASEMSNVPLLDRERMTALWRDWLRPFFHIPMQYLYPSSSSLATMVNIESNQDIWPTGTMVLTAMGQGRVLSFRSEDNMYEVALKYGRGFFRSTSIIGAEELSQSSIRAIGINENQSNATSKCFSLDPGNSLIYGTSLSYAFLRVHNLLYTRLLLARDLCKQADVSSSNAHPLSTLDATDDQTDDLIRPNKTESSTKNTSSFYQIHYHNAKNATSSSRYQSFLTLLVTFMNGSIEQVRYEDLIRQMLGNRAYLLFTIDKLITTLLKMLQQLSNDDTFNRLVGLFVYHRSQTWQQDTTIESPINCSTFIQHLKQVIPNTYADELYRLQVMFDKDMKVNTQVAIQCVGTIGNIDQQVSSSNLTESDTPSNTNAMDVTE